MYQSDLSKLETYVHTLPDNKVMMDQWNERYIDDIKHSLEYDNVKQLAIIRNRYVRVEDMSEYGYSLDKYKSLCDAPPPNLFDEDNDIPCHKCCVEQFSGPMHMTGADISSSDISSSDEKRVCIYDEDICNRFFAQRVKNWSDVCRYHILFLQGKTPGTPDHPGPWNRETRYIIDPLIRMLRSNILPRDSQPGLLVQDDTSEDYMQKPYLSLGGPAGRIHRILVKLLNPPSDNITLDNSIIKYVPYNIKILRFWGYENYEEDVNNNYISIMLGLNTPPILTREISEYILSNRFFDRIADVVETTR